MISPHNKNALCAIGAIYTLPGTIIVKIKTTILNRICKLCNLNQIEDEKPVLFFGTLYDDIRRTWTEALKLCMPDFEYCILVQIIS